MMVRVAEGRRDLRLVSLPGMHEDRTGCLDENPPLMSTRGYPTCRSEGAIGVTDRQPKLCRDGTRGSIRGVSLVTGDSDF